MPHPASTSASAFSSVDGHISTTKVYNDIKKLQKKKKKKKKKYMRSTDINKVWSYQMNILFNNVLVIWYVVLTEMYDRSS